MRHIAAEAEVDGAFLFSQASLQHKESYREEERGRHR